MGNSPDGNPPQMKDIPENKKLLFGKSFDGDLAVCFSESNLEVYADFIPPKATGKPLTLDDIAAALNEINVIYGRRWEAIQEALLDCNLGRLKVANVLIAVGDHPENEISEYYEKDPQLKKAETYEGEENRIDHRTRSPFVIVKKDQALATLIPRKPGKEGKNVNGEVFPFSVIKIEGVTGGDNTRIEDGFILSNIHGQLIEDKKTLQVRNNLVIRGSVGYKTGHIIFPGNIEIEGPVSDGFKIYSGGSITIKQTFDVTEAVTKGDLVVVGGIIGRGLGVLKVGGGIKTRFIENCRVAARKTIIVEKELNNSRVFSLGRVEVSDKGLILGCEIQSVNGLKAGTIGRKAGKASRIHCGLDFTVQQEIDKNNSKLQILAAKMAKLKDLLTTGNPDAEKKSQIEELLRGLEEQQANASRYITKLLGSLIANEKAVVEVSGEISMGTLIEICQIAFFVDKPLRKVRIRLNKEAGKLITEPL